jgi:hypothetical protein
MTTNAMARAVTTCGIGTCLIGAGLLLKNDPVANANPPLPAAIASAALAQDGGPTVVWYGTYGGNGNGLIAGAILRAWSDGRIEMKKVSYFSSSSADACSASTPCSSPWLVISNPAQGLPALADLNADESVDASDLATVLSRWGDAPRVEFPPSDCPLGLINP